MRARIATGLDDIDPADWDALGGEHNPFVEHAFLHLLETSGSASAEEGWAPLHVVIEDGSELVGAAPCYLKDASYGEYIFDWMWAEAAQRAGLPYFPKLLVGVPFTPATGPRLLTHPGRDPASVRGALVDGLEGLRREVGAAGVHVLFCQDDEATFLASRGYARRASHQFHWRNDGYESFSAFLESLRSGSRKQIRKERRRVEESELTVELRRGDELDLEEWQALHRLYVHTGGRKWGTPYLKSEFFEGARERIGARALVCFARREGRIVAGTLSFVKGKHLYGRYWGAFEPADMLHFELCYYQLIEHAIREGLTLVEAGAQGPHKLKRGFLPVVTHSAHKLAHEGLHAAVERAVRQEAAALVAEIEEAQRAGPFREEALPDLPAVAGVPLPGE
jgi:uncharacterized protein